jgi:hypothetical protein
MQTSPKPVPKKNQPRKRSAAWRREVHREAMAALARAKARDALWRAKREEQRRARGVS